MYFVGKDSLEHPSYKGNGKVGTAPSQKTPDVYVQTTVDRELQHWYLSWTEEANPQAGGIHAYEVTDQGVLRVWAIPLGVKRGDPRKLVRVYSPVGYSYVVGTTLESLDEAPAEAPSRPARPNVMPRGLPPRPEQNLDTMKF